MNNVTAPTALIIGASRGLGLGLVDEYLKRDWHVIATVRGERTEAHERLPNANGRLAIEQLDITIPAELEALKTRLARRTLDLLFVNAGISNGPRETIADVTTDDFIRVMVTNALAPMRVIEAFESLVSEGGTIGCMSSGLGSVADNTSGGWEVYRASKAGLNTLMRSFAARHCGDSRTFLLIAPGWIRTAMGGEQATFSIEENIPCVVDTISNASGTPGLHYLDYRGETVRW